MSELKIYYSIHNAGDGSAYPIFLESRELANWDTNHLDEGWGEDCDGWIIVESETPMVCGEVVTAIGYYLDKCEDGCWYTDTDQSDFEECFFPMGLPTFEVRIQATDSRKYYVFVEGVLHYKASAWVRALGKSQTSEQGRLKLETRLNK